MYKPVASETETSGSAIRMPAGKSGRSFELRSFKASAIREGDKGEVTIEMHIITDKHFWDRSIAFGCTSPRLQKLEPLGLQ